jgi:hypothetical protein
MERGRKGGKKEGWEGGTPNDKTVRMREMIKTDALS